MLTAQLTKTLGASGDPLGSFVTKFDSVPAEKLYAGDPKTLQMCRDSIVLIGGQWHLDSGYSESYNDAHFSPAGEISGLAFHANYVESLLNPNAVSREVPAPFAVILDIFIGMLIYAGFDSEHQWIKVLMLVVAFAIAPVVAYLALNLTNSYLDFLLPSELYFLHVLYEYIHQHL
jgi:CHASE2 domain-containing sensor protein